MAEIRVAAPADESPEAVVLENLNSEYAGELTVFYSVGTKIYSSPKDFVSSERCLVLEWDVMDSSGQGD